MNVEVFSFCKYATGANGSLNLQETFDQWESDVFPVKLPDFYLVLRIRLPKEFPARDCQLLFLDPDGELAMPPTKLKVTGPVTNAILKNRNVNFDKPGIYHAALRDGGRVISSLPLFVTKTASRNVVPASSLN